MNYLLNGCIRFSTTEFFLMNINTGDTIHLPPSSALILDILIKNQGHVVERDTFFDSAWNDYNVEVSGNTLNQYISLLRKNLKLLGEDKEFILTAPRIGFSLAETVTVSNTPDNRINLQLPHLPLKWILYTLFFIVLGEIIYLALADSKPPVYTPAQAGLIGSCEVYSSHNLIKGYGKEALQIAKDMAEKFLPCHSNSVYFFDVNSGLLFQHDGRAFLARCDKIASKDIFSACQEVLMYSINRADDLHK